MPQSHNNQNTSTSQKPASMNEGLGGPPIEEIKYALKELDDLVKKKERETAIKKIIHIIIKADDFNIMEIPSDQALWDEINDRDLAPDLLYDIVIYGIHRNIEPLIKKLITIIIDIYHKEEISNILTQAWINALLKEDLKIQSCIECSAKQNAIFLPNQKYINNYFIDLTNIFKIKEKSKEDTDEPHLKIIDRIISLVDFETLVQQEQVLRDNKGAEQCDLQRRNPNIINSIYTYIIDEKKKREKGKEEGMGDVEKKLATTEKISSSYQSPVSSNLGAKSTGQNSDNLLNNNSHPCSGNTTPNISSANLAESADGIEPQRNKNDCFPENPNADPSSPPATTFNEAWKILMEETAKNTTLKEIREQLHVKCFLKNMNMSTQNTKQRVDIIIQGIQYYVKREKDAREFKRLSCLGSMGFFDKIFNRYAKSDKLDAARKAIRAYWTYDSNQVTHVMFDQKLKNILSHGQLGKLKLLDPIKHLQTTEFINTDL